MERPKEASWADALPEDPSQGELAGTPILLIWAPVAIMVIMFIMPVEISAITRNLEAMDHESIIWRPNCDEP